MRTKKTTLSFLTESKSSAVGLSSMQRVAMTLLVMLLTTVSAIAENYTLTLDANCEGGVSRMIPVSGFTPTYTLTQSDVPIREGHTFYGWSKISVGAAKYKTGDQVELTDNLTLYAIWEDTPLVNLKYKITDEDKRQVMVTGYEEFLKGTLNIPATVTLNGTEYSVTSIGNYAFENCSSLQSVTIPNSVTSIGDCAFSGCSNLQSVTIPNSVTSIGDNAFKDCSSLQSVTIPNSVTTIGVGAFEFCSNLQSVTIPNSVTSIGNCAFWGCSSLQSVTIPNSVTSIGDLAFCRCRNLQSVTIPNSVTSIGNNAFSDCSSLQSVTIPNSVTSIGDFAFSGCSSLQSVTIPNSVTSIKDGAFFDCSSLQSVTIPNSVTNIGVEAFWGCSSLQSVTIPNSVTSIGNDAFSYCPNLQSVTINSNPKIGTDAFLGTPVTVTMNLTASKIDGDYWTTFYNNGYNFQADGNTTVYKGTVNESSLVLTEVEDKIVNSGTAVILKSSGNPVMTLTETGSNDTNGNDLRGISDRTKRTSVISNFSANEIYTMGNTSVGFGFHRYTGEYVPAGKAFLPLNTSDGAKAQSLSIVFAIGTTGINSVSSDSNVQNDWFSLDGTRLSGKPSQPGIYVNGKKKVVIK